MLCATCVFSKMMVVAVPAVSGSVPATPKLGLGAAPPSMIPVDTMSAPQLMMEPATRTNRAWVCWPAMAIVPALRHVISGQERWAFVWLCFSA